MLHHRTPPLLLRLRPPAKGRPYRHLLRPPSAPHRLRRHRLRASPPIPPRQRRPGRLHSLLRPTAEPKRKKIQKHLPGCVDLQRSFRPLVWSAPYGGIGPADAREWLNAIFAPACTTKLLAGTSGQHAVDRPPTTRRLGQPRLFKIVFKSCRGGGEKKIEGSCEEHSKKRSVFTRIPRSQIQRCGSRTWCQRCFVCGRKVGTCRGGRRTCASEGGVSGSLEGRI